MNEHDILHQFLYTGGSVLLGLAGVGIKSLTSAWASKVRNQTLAQVIRNTDEVVMHVVKSIYQTHVKPRTRQTRELSQQDGIHIRRMALDEIKKHLGKQVLKDLSSSFGNDVDRVLGHHLEAAVQDLKYQRSHPNTGALPLNETHRAPPPQDACPALVQTQEEALQMQQAWQLKRAHEQAQAGSQSSQQNP